MTAAGVVASAADNVEKKSKSMTLVVIKAYKVGAEASPFSSDSGFV